MCVQIASPQATNLQIWQRWIFFLPTAEMLMQCIFVENNQYLLDSGMHIYLDTLNLNREILTYLLKNSLCQMYFLKFVTTISNC